MTALLTPRQVAAQIGVHYKTALDLIASGEIPSTNISGGHGTGKRYRTSQRDLDRWLESRRIPP